ncbi:nck-associated protein 5 isoform X4 [Mustela lutreola]|uniref:nck-associated protein 5 isoform X4 n=1 Tax=Mustela lutreola TaxID=9666 RepID=UPI0027976FE2|nr:nck-associated protein 5 isoform X4 [Mustela lutreola]
MEGKRQLEKRDFGKRLSLDSSLVEYMDSNKYIEHLLTQLEEQHRNLWREKLAVARLQREVAQRGSEGAMHEKLMHELEEERHLRLQSEKRLQEVTLESERNRIQMRGLQQQFSRMEETVRNLLKSQGPPEQKKEETVNIMVYQEKLSEEERKHKETLDSLHMVVDEDSRSESSSADEGKENTKFLLERLKALEAENSALALENENQREQYERCLDEVANQVVQALLTQKDLREECVKLKTRVFDLEQQNRTLSILFQQRIRPTSDLLLQKLHSRILDLSSGDLLSDMERSRSLMQSRTDVEMHECQLSAKSGVPALKCPGLGVVIPGRLCPRNSCSSSELSLSSTCSEYSSGSSHTWHDGKNLRKRVRPPFKALEHQSEPEKNPLPVTRWKKSSQNWDKRLSIDSSLPSGFASPTDELPPARIKESHILEGLRKLQKRKVLLEPPSVITKWGYKDCMNSNEGIYSPGIKSSSLKDYPPCKPADRRSPCKEPHETFVYDTDSHDDADEDSSSLPLLQAVPSQGCRLHSRQLTHSVSDSLFGWEPNRKHFSEGTSSVYSRERPEKLASCASNCPLERKLCPHVQMPQVRREREPCDPGSGHVALSLQLSDTDDNEALDELHIGSSDEKSPSDLSLTADTDKSMENLDILVGFGKSQLGSPEEEEKQVPIPLESRPKTFSFIKQQRVVKRTSSEECITVIFDAEDGEPIEFSSHQTGIVTVTRNEISINQAPTGPKAEHTELSPQGIAHLQLGAAARDYTFLKRPEEETKKNIPKGDIDNMVVARNGSFSPRTVTQSPQRQRPGKPALNLSCQSSSRSSVSMGIYQKQSLTKGPARGKASPQKSKIMEPEASARVPSSGPVSLEKSPALAPGKLSRFKKTEGPAPLFDLHMDSHIPKHPSQLLHGSKMSSRKDWVPCSKNQIPASQLLPRSLTEPSDNGESLTRDKHCDSGPEAGVKSPSPPPPPDRSGSLLVRPSYGYMPPPSSAKPETRVPSEAARTMYKSPPLKGPSAPIISSNQILAEVPGKKPSVAFRKPVFTHPPPSTETVIQTRCSAHTPSSSFAVMAPGPPKVSPKRGVPKTPPHQMLGTTQMDPGLRTPKNCPLAHEPLEILSSKSVSPGRKGQLNDCVPTSAKPSFLGVNEAPSSQVSSHSSSPSSKSHNTPYGCPNTHEKGLKTRLPVGLKVLMKSPQLLRKSSTVPGKHEKDSLNEASKSSVDGSKSKPEDVGNPVSLETVRDERNVTPLGFQVQDRLPEGIPLDTTMPESLENCVPGADGKDGVENKSVKRSLSSSKPHLKPALGMNGAKARSQSFSTYSGDKPPTPPMEGSGKVRTQIITNTAERGNSLTRQSSSTEGLPKTPSAPMSDGLSGAGRPLGHPSSRQGSPRSTGSSSSQHGSPSKLPLRVPPKSEELPTPCGMEDEEGYPEGGGPREAVPEETSSDHYRYPPTPADCPQALQNPGRTQHPTNFEPSRTSKLETSGRCPDTSTTRTGAVSPEAPLSPTIEEKVMLCIQENVEKGQVQTKSPSVEAKPKPGPSFASWFGFRSRLPALSSRKMDVSKTKVEKKDAKGLGFGNKQLKSEKKKEKKKPELQRKIENELTRNTKVAESPDSSLRSKNDLKTPQGIYDQMKFEPRNRPSPVTCSTKDTFMTELLNRVDKKAAQQTESGSNNVSCRSVLKGSFQGSCLTSSSASTQGNHKKNIKTKADVEIPKGSLIKEASVSLQEDEDTVADSTFQSHIIESNCLMRTLDSGIGTFPLPDSGNRSTGRYLCHPDFPEDTEPILSLQPALCAASSIRAQTLEREVPSSADSQASADNTIVHSTSDPIMTARAIRPLESRLPKPASSGKINSQKQNEAEPRPQTCSSFEYTENAITSEQLPDWGGEGPMAETQDKVPRMCAYSASAGSASDSDLDYGDNGFGAGRGKLVQAMKSATQGPWTRHEQGTEVERQQTTSRMSDESRPRELGQWSSSLRMRGGQGSLTPR